MRRVRSYMESLAEIQHRIESGGPKSRPTVYHGITFRSRLEARFAWHLDDLGIRWRYEPRIYGPKGRGYLPDFELLGGACPTFVEVKPTLAEVDGAKAKMSVIWETAPNAVLVVACAEDTTYFGCRRDGEWESWADRWAA